jgi:hypothetical protein
MSNSSLMYKYLLLLIIIIITGNTLYTLVQRSPTDCRVSKVWYRETSNNDA